MVKRSLQVGLVVAAMLVALAGPLAAAEIAPHRALYKMSLGRAGGDSRRHRRERHDGLSMGRGLRRLDRRAALPHEDGLLGIARCQHRLEFRDLGSQGRAALPLQPERDAQRRRRGRGQAAKRKLDGPGQGGSAQFEQPNGKTLKLPPAVLFPSAHTIALLRKAEAGENFMSQLVFDGATAENAVLVSAVIGPKVDPDPDAAKKSPLLNRPGWRVRLAFFPADQKAEKPDYELGMVLLDNGVSRDMIIDYGDYAIRAKLDDIEPLPKPGC